MDKIQDLTGEKAVHFKLQDEDGKTRSLDDYKGKWLLMVFHRHHG